jgi:hypothetical protein
MNSLIRLLGEILEASRLHPRIEKMRGETAELEKLDNDFGGESGIHGKREPTKAYGADLLTRC